MRLNLVPFLPRLDETFANAVLVNLKRIRDLFNTASFVTGDYKWSEQVADHPGWLLINVAARSLSRRDYPALFSLLGTKYGAADANHFNLPPAAGRTLVVAGQGTGLTNRISGQIFGTENHLLTEAQLPTHNHGFGVNLNFVGDIDGFTPSVNNIATTAGATGYYMRGATQKLSLVPSGSNQVHNIMQPSLALNLFIHV